MSGPRLGELLPQLWRVSFSYGPAQFIFSPLIHGGANRRTTELEEIWGVALLEFIKEEILSSSLLYP